MYNVHADVCMEVLADGAKITAACSVFDVHVSISHAILIIVLLRFYVPAFSLSGL